MNLTQGCLDTIQKMAELFYSIELIAANIEVDADELKANILAKQGKVYTYYIKGWIIGDMKLRDAIAKAADNGSNPAQQMMREYQQHNTIVI